MSKFFNHVNLIIMLIMVQTNAQDICGSQSYGESEMEARQKATASLAQAINSSVSYNSKTEETIDGIESKQKDTTIQQISSKLLNAHAAKYEKGGDAEGYFSKACMSAKDAAKPYLDSLKHLDINMESCKNIASLENVIAPLAKMDNSLKKEYDNEYAKASKECKSMVIERGSFTDTRNGTTYETVKIGSLVWMAKNLDYQMAGSLCYDKDDFNCDKYGRLYNWNAAREACPSGWHLPKQSEWGDLINVAGKDVAGKSLKAKAKIWNGTDNLGFFAMPGGRLLDGNFEGINDYGNWWTATNDDRNDSNAYVRFMGSKYDSVGQNPRSKSRAYSVRCVKDGSSRPSGSQTGPSTSNKTELGGKRGSATGGFNDGYAEGGSGGIGDMLGGLMGGSTGSKAPSQRDIDMGSGDGSRSKADIMAVINQRMPGLRRIYNQHLKTNPGLTGKVTVKFTIAPDGDIISINIVSSTTGDSKFDEAIKNAVATWKWKAIKSGNTTPTIPFNFSE